MFFSFHKYCEEHFCEFEIFHNLELRFPYFLWHWDFHNFVELRFPNFYGIEISIFSWKSVEHFSRLCGIQFLTFLTYSINFSFSGFSIEFVETFPLEFQFSKVDDFTLIVRLELTNLLCTCIALLFMRKKTA